MSHVDPYDPDQNHTDPAVQALIHEGWLGEWDAPIAVADLENAVKHVRNADTPAGQTAVTFTADQLGALSALLNLVHYDNLASEWFNLLPAEIRQSARRR